MIAVGAYLKNIDLRVLLGLIYNLMVYVLLAYSIVNPDTLKLSLKFMYSK